MGIKTHSDLLKEIKRLVEWELAHPESMSENVGGIGFLITADGGRMQAIFGDKTLDYARLEMARLCTYKPTQALAVFEKTARLPAVKI
jgi:hypothetical protein